MASTCRSGRRNCNWRARRTLLVATTRGRQPFEAPGGLAYEDVFGGGPGQDGDDAEARAKFRGNVLQTMDRDVNFSSLQSHFQLLGKNALVHRIGAAVEFGEFQVLTQITR